jgi:VanZ family protein
LLTATGLSLRLAVTLECALLFATSYLQTFMPGHSAEISDALLALIVGWIYAYMRRQYRDVAPASFLEMKQAVGS